MMRFAANRHSKTEPEATAVTLISMTLRNNVAGIEVAGAAAAVVRPRFFF